MIRSRPARLLQKQGSGRADSGNLPVGACGAIQVARNLNGVIGACDRPCPLRAGALLFRGRQ